MASNICSNQALVAFLANLYLRKLGKTNFTKLSTMSYENAHKLAKKLEELGIKVLNNDFFDEFTIEINSDEFLKFMKNHNILAGTKLSDNNVLVSPTELNDDDEITGDTIPDIKLSIDEYIESSKMPLESI